MFKSFAVALLPIAVLAAGDNDGTSQVNAYEVELIDNELGTMTLLTYNADNGGVNEFHGELLLRYSSNDTIMTGFA